ncbi:response regulator transcription factor [Sorangium sp. So ce341]|uniref:response regulator transcription factor n=1 Tax=Sorangium sp. So ce341 TaxID=3133302 RepID=UPI003F5ECEE3
MARILLVDDDASLLEVLALAFQEAGHATLSARDGTAALALVRKERPEAVVCDVNMPGLDGFSLCRRLREQGDAVPLILLTSRDSEIDETLGLDLGADDYIAKPFSMRVLLARVAALLRRDALRRRAEAEPAPPAPIESGPLKLSPDRLEVLFHGRHVAVTVTEFRLLEALVRRPDLVLSRARLLSIVRGDDTVVVDRIVDTYVRRLRRKLEQVDPAFDRIETVIGAGYRFRALRG